MNLKLLSFIFGISGLFLLMISIMVTIVFSYFFDRFYKDNMKYPDKKPWLQVKEWREKKIPYQSFPFVLLTVLYFFVFLLFTITFALLIFCFSYPYTLNNIFAIIVYCFLCLVFIYLTFKSFTSIFSWFKFGNSYFIFSNNPIKLGTYVEGKIFIDKDNTFSGQEQFNIKLSCISRPKDESTRRNIMLIEDKVCIANCEGKKYIPINTLMNKEGFPTTNNGHILIYWWLEIAEDKKNIFKYYSKFEIPVF